MSTSVTVSLRTFGGVLLGALALLLVGAGLSPAAGQGNGDATDAVARLQAEFDVGVPIVRQLRDRSASDRRELRALFNGLDAAEKQQLRAHYGVASRAGSATPSRRGAANPTLQYDTGNAHVFRVPTQGQQQPPPIQRGPTPTPATGEGVGNFFDVGFSDPHTISQIQFQLNGLRTFSGGAGTVSMVVGGPVSGSSAPVLASLFVPAAVGFNTYTLSPPAATAVQNFSGPFVVVIRQSGTTVGTPYSPNTGVTNVAVDTNAPSTRGPVDIFNGVVFQTVYVPDRAPGPSGALLGANTSPLVPAPTSMGAPNLSDLRPFNAIVRVTGPSLPVELMHFSIDEK